MGGEGSNQQRAMTGKDMAKGDLVQSDIRSKLNGLRLALRGRLMGEGLAWLLAALVALVFVTFAFDYLLRPDRVLRGAIMFLALVAVGCVVYRRLVAPLRVPMDAVGLSLLIERHFGQLGDRLISAIQFSESSEKTAAPVSRVMIDRMAEQANQLARPLKFSSVIEPKGLWRISGVAGLAIAVLLAFGIWQGDLMGLWFRRNVLLADAPWPQQTYLRVLGGPDFTVVRGEDITIVIEVSEESSKVPSVVTLHAKLPSVGRTVDDLKCVPGDRRRFEKVFQTVAEPFEFYVTGGDDRRDKRRPHRISIVNPPMLTGVQFELEYPKYMNRKIKSFGEGVSTLTVPLGGWIHIIGRSTKDLESAGLFLDCEALRRQQRLREELVKSTADQATVCDRLHAVGEAVKSGRITSHVRRKLRDCGNLRAAVNAQLAKLVSGQRTILDEIRNNPPSGREVEVGDIRPGILEPLGRLAAGSKALDDKFFKESASEEDAGELRVRLETVTAAQRKLRDEMKAKMPAIVEKMQAVEAWMAEVPARIYPVAIEGTNGPEAPRGLSARLYVWGHNRPESMMIRIAMTDCAGITNRNALRCPVQVYPDGKPNLDLKKYGVGSTVTPQAIVPLALHAKDDCGLKGVRVAYRARGVAATQSAAGVVEGSEPVEDVPAGLKEIRIAHALRLKSRGLRAGQFLSIWALAEDTMPGDFGGPNVGRSASQTLRIVTEGEMMDSLIARQKQVRVEFEQAIAMQNLAGAKTVSASNELTGGEITADVRRKLEESSALQGTVGAECAKCADTLAAILEEMKNNQVATAADYDVLENKIIRPIRALTENMSLLTASINETKSARKASDLAEQAGEIAAIQSDLLRQMLGILKNMKKLQNRQELASKLKRLLKSWNDWLKDARKESDKQKEKALEATTRPTTIPATD